MADDRRSRSTVKFPVVKEVPTDPPSASPVPIVNTTPTSSGRLEQAPLSVPAASGRPSRQPSFIDSDWLDAETNVTRPTETSIEAAPVHVARDRALLTTLSGVNAGQVFTVEGSETVIGRGRDAQLRIEDVGISRAHTRILHSIDGKFIVEDMKSTNGTFLNGKRIDHAEMKSGDRVQIGPNVVLRFAIIDEAEEQLAHQLYEASTKDALTKVYNRKYFIERLTAEIAYAHRHKTHLSIVLLDLDHFKKVNDTYGHLAGDVVLRVVVAQMQRTIRTEDVLARYGGEEFVILVRGIEHKNVAHFGERVRRAVERLQIPWENTQLKATVSAGVSSLLEVGDAAGGEKLLHLADERLYKAKAGGRNRVVYT